MHAIARQRVLELDAGVTQKRTETRGGLEELRRLTPDDREVAFLIQVRIARVEKLQHFSLGDHVGGVGENLEHRNTFGGYHQLKGARIQKVADEHACCVAESGIGRRVSATKRRLVDHVVVQQS